MKWFKHDTDANLDAKLQNVLLDYGLEGYGLYWYCLELIAGKVGKDNVTFELEHDARVIARNTGCTVQKVEEMMKYFVTIKLFENADGVVTCLKLAKRLDQSMTSNPDMRNIINTLKSHDSIMMNSDKVMQDKIRLDKTRVEEKRIDNKDITIVKQDSVIDDLFEQFWSAGMVKVNKKKALTVFRAKAKMEDNPKYFAGILVLDIHKRLTANQFGFDKMHPTTYLNGERWNDDIQTNTPVNQSVDLSSTNWAGDKVFDPTYLER